MTTTPNSEFLLDANVLVYTVDASNSIKQQRAQEVVSTLGRSGKGCLSVQVLGEFYRASTQRIPEKLPRPLAARVVQAWLDTWLTLPTTVAVLRAAAPIASEHQLQIWDAVICATATLNDIPYILSEDMQNRQLIDGVQILNPFLPDFNLSQLV
jgi:predicted nucleic acid-binding protein